MQIKPAASWTLIIVATLTASAPAIAQVAARGKVDEEVTCR